jgi:hypothetical protein
MTEDDTFRVLTKWDFEKAYEEWRSINSIPHLTLRQVEFWLYETTGWDRYKLLAEKRNRDERN